MKRNLIGSVVGGLIIFIWQFISWAAMDLHRSGSQYTPKEDSILAFLDNIGLEEGAYFIPGVPPDTPMAEYEQRTQAAAGKPWAQIAYHKVMQTDMVMNQVRGVLVDIVMVFLLIWIIGKFGRNSFSTTFLASLFTGVIVFLNSAYTQHIWFETFDLYSHLTDAIAAWGACGLWLGWWLNRKKA